MFYLDPKERLDYGRSRHRDFAATPANIKRDAFSIWISVKGDDQLQSESISLRDKIYKRLEGRL